MPIAYLDVHEGTKIEEKKVLAKGIASGLPLGAFIARDTTMSWGPGSHGSTFGGNPVACAAAMATIDLLEAGLTASAAEVGEALLHGLADLARRHPGVVRDARGLGLMLALEMATPELAGALVEGAFRRGLLLLPCGNRAGSQTSAMPISSSSPNQRNCE